MRKVIIVTWIIIVIASSGILAYSTLYEIDSYQTVLDFKFTISDVTISTNATENFDSFSIIGTFWNPSYFSSVRLRSIENTVVLNDRGSEYFRKLHWFTSLSPPRTNRSLILTLNILPQDIGIFNEANASATWNWSFNLKVNLVSSIIDAGQYDRSQEYTGVTMTSS